MVCGELGDKDQAFDYLERAIAQHDDQVSFMAVDHRFDSLRGDPRFDAALRRLGLPVLDEDVRAAGSGRAGQSASNRSETRQELVAAS